MAFAYEAKYGFPATPTPDCAAKRLHPGYMTAIRLRIKNCQTKGVQGLPCE